MMPSMQKGSCSWSLLAAVGTILVLFSVVHMFLFPSGPTLDYLLDYFGVRQAQTSCVPTYKSTRGIGSIQHDMELDLDHQFFADLHNAVVYCGAPWKTEIGRWLSACDTIVEEIRITEKISGKTCRNACNGQGVCNYELGQRRCFHGFTGQVCSEALNLACNYPVSPEQPYGPWVVSICPASCGTEKAMCFCGEGTKYPNRPVAEACGFKIKSRSEPGVPILTDWGKPDMDVLTTNSSVPGWCNVDIEEGCARKVKFKEECHCKYDGRTGKICEIPVLSTCINQCSGDGHCRGGFCQGWYGVDCSIPSVFSSIRDWPRWLRPAQVDIPGNADLGESIASLNTEVMKRRPLIYVYDLPPQFNSLLLGFFSWDEGACYAPKEIWSSMVLVHWGNTKLKHNHSTTAYWPDNWDDISPSRRGSHHCFDPKKDIVLPAWKLPDENSLRAKLWARPSDQRKIVFYFDGNLGSAYENGRRESYVSSLWEHSTSKWDIDFAHF